MAHSELARHGLCSFFAAAAGVDASAVNSPTFVLCQLYEGNRSIVHLDVYRIKNEEEFLNLGPDELFAGSDVTFIEWGDRVRNCLPKTCVELSIDVAGAESRRFTLRAPPELIQSVASRLDSESE